MWFEILPSFGIITGVLMAPTVIMYFTNKLVLGNSFKRDLVTFQSQYMYQRDTRLTGSAYKCNGLEAIPDK